MFEISVEGSFSAAHHLINYNGPCEKIHGHNWNVKATVMCEKTNSIGIGIDFRVLKNLLSQVLKELDHTDLNSIFEPMGLNPSSENCAKYIYEKLELLIANNPCKLIKVEVTETHGNTAAYLR